MNKIRKSGRKSKIPEKEYFESIYYNENVTIEEMAKLWGVKKQTIYNWAFKYRNQIIENNLSDKQIFTQINNTKKKERSKIS